MDTTADISTVTRRPTPDTPILECRNLSVSYSGRRHGGRHDTVPAVVDFNLTLQRGEAHGLVGESGCGKSTVALAIMRYLGAAGRVVGGQILFQGRDLLGLDAEALRKIRGAAIAMIYQEPMASLNPSMTIGEQLVEVPMYHESVGRREAVDRARTMLERVRLADTQRIMQSYPHQVSGGQQQRVVIAMALLSHPQLLLLDEPTTALDVTVEAGIVDLIRDISAEFGTSMLYISHNLGLVRETCDRMTVMYCGQQVEVGPVKDVFRRMRHPYTRGLFAAIPSLVTDKSSRPLRAIPGQLPTPGTRPPGCVFGPRCAEFVAGRCDVGPIPMSTDTDAAAPTGAPAASLTGASAVAHTARCVRLGDPDRATSPQVERRSPGTFGEPLLKVAGLTKRYQHVRANDGLDFHVRRGETLAIVGESGCGKSTFARILMGLTQGTSGTIHLSDLELSRLPVARRSTKTVRSLQMVFQNPFDTLNPSHTVGSQIARVIRKFGVEREESRIRARVLALLDLVKLPRDVADRLPRQLSGGQKQRIGVARAFAGNPSVVVADEPVSALDVSVQAAVTELLLDLQRREGTTLLFISHDLSVVRYLADRIIVMYLGQILEQGRTTEIFEPPYHPYTEALLAAVPVADPSTRKRKVLLTGDLPSASNPPKGCPFSTRCGHRIAGQCEVQVPPVQEFGPTHRIACHLPREQLLAMQPVFTATPPTASSA
jgi:peptide/nickel transport system ATP-binding protein